MRILTLEMFVINSGNGWLYHEIINCYDDVQNFGVRPVVCLKSDLQVTSTTTDGATTWTIQK